MIVFNGMHEVVAASKAPTRISSEGATITATTGRDTGFRIESRGQTDHSALELTDRRYFSTTVKPAGCVGRGAAGQVALICLAMALVVDVGSRQARRSSLALVLLWYRR